MNELAKASSKLPEQNTTASILSTRHSLALKKEEILSVENLENVCQITWRPVIEEETEFPIALMDMFKIKEYRISYV
jgi:hypothetical protein